MTKEEFSAFLKKEMADRKLDEYEMTLLADTSLNNMRRWLHGEVLPPAYEIVIKILKESR